MNNSLRPLSIFYILGALSACLVIFIALVFTGAIQLPWVSNNISGYWTSSDYIYLIDDKDGDLFVRSARNTIGEIKSGATTNRFNIEQSDFKGTGLRDNTKVTFRCASLVFGKLSSISHSQEINARLTINNRLTGFVHTTINSYSTPTSSTDNSRSTTSTFYAIKRDAKEIQQWIDK